MSLLFTPTRIGTLTLANRIVIAPMCQYSAIEGALTDWHLIHLGSLALSGAGLLIIEASAVTPEGRISPADAGLWDDHTEAAMARVLAGVRANSKMPIAIQLAHAGRKASTPVPWHGGGQLAPDSASGWQTLAPSAVSFADTDALPLALDTAGLARIREAFAAVAMPVIGVGMITEPAQAEAVLGDGDADMVGLARAMLYDPRWPWHAAAALGAQITPPSQYLRSSPVRGLFKHI